MRVPRINVRKCGVIPIKETAKFVASFGIIKPLKWISNSLALGGLLFFTTSGNIVTNRILQATGWAPKPTNSKNNNQEIGGNRFDGFFARQENFRSVLNTFKRLDIDPKTLNESKDGMIFNKREDRQKAKELLTERINHEKDETIKSDIQSAINTINDIDVLDQLIFGTNGLDPDKYSQGGVPNCQILAAVKGLSLSNENIQELKNLIEVSSYSLGSENVYLDTIVHLNGMKISIPFAKLKEKLSPRDFCPTTSTDGSLAVSILSIAIEEAAKKYDSIPHLLQSTSPILLTGKDYVSIATWSLSDENLKEVLSLAPGTPITVGSFVKAEDLTIENVIREYNEKYNKKEPSISPEKEEEFQNTIKQKTIKITTPITKNDLDDKIGNRLEKKEGVSLLASEGGLLPKSQFNPSQIPKSRIISNHQYAIKSFRQDGDKTEIIVTDSHNNEYEPLDLDSFRKHMFIIVLPREHVPLINFTSTVAGTIILLSLLLARKGLDRANRLIYPEHQTYFEMGIAHLRKKTPKSTEPVVKEQPPQ